MRVGMDRPRHSEADQGRDGVLRVRRGLWRPAARRQLRDRRADLSRSEAVARTDRIQESYRAGQGRGRRPAGREGEDHQQVRFSVAGSPRGLMERIGERRDTAVGYRPDAPDHGRKEQYGEDSVPEAQGRRGGRRIPAEYGILPGRRYILGSSGSSDSLGPAAASFQTATSS